MQRSCRYIDTRRLFQLSLLTQGKISRKGLKFSSSSQTVKVNRCKINEGDFSQQQQKTNYANNQSKCFKLPINVSNNVNKLFRFRLLVLFFPCSRIFFQVNKQTLQNRISFFFKWKFIFFLLCLFCFKNVFSHRFYSACI